MLIYSYVSPTSEFEEIQFLFLFYGTKVELERIMIVLGAQGDLL